MTLYQDPILIFSCPGCYFRTPWVSSLEHHMVMKHHKKLWISEELRQALRRDGYLSAPKNWEEVNENIDVEAIERNANNP